MAHGHGGGHMGGGGGNMFGGFREGLGEIGSLFTTKHGLKEVAHAAAGGDPFASAVTGLALGVTGFGIKLGMKGASGTFNGLKTVLGGKSKQNIHDDLHELGKKQQDSLDPVRDILDKGLLKDKGMLGSVDEKLGELIKYIKTLNVTNENTGKATKTNLDRLRRDMGVLAATDKKDIYFKKRTEVEQSKQTKLLEKQERDRRRQRTIIPKKHEAAAQNNHILGLDKLVEAVKRGFALLTTVSGIKSIFSGMSAAFTVAMGMLGKVIFKALPSILGKVARLALKGVIIFQLITAVAGGITEAIAQFAKTGSFKQAMFGFIGGVMETISMGFLKGDELVVTMNRMWDDTGKIFKKISGVVSSTWDSLIPKLESGGKYALDFIVDKWTGLFESINTIFTKFMEFTRKWVIFQLEKLPFGEKLSRAFKSDNENAEDDYVDERAKLKEEFDRIQKKRREIDGGSLGDTTTARENLKVLDQQEARLAKRIGELSKNEIHKTMSSRERVQEAVKNTDSLNAKQTAPQIITVAPVVSANAQTQNNHSNFSVPMSVRNSERTIDRVSASHR